jgi:hypothetical protein
MSDFSNFPSGWVKYGLPNLEEHDVWRRVAELVMNYFSMCGYEAETCGCLEVGSGCFVLTREQLLTEEQWSEVKRIVLDNTPSGWVCHIHEEDWE